MQRQLLVTHVVLHCGGTSDSKEIAAAILFFEKEVMCGTFGY